MSREDAGAPGAAVAQQPVLMLYLSLGRKSAKYSVSIASRISQIYAIRNPDKLLRMDRVVDLSR